MFKHEKYTYAVGLILAGGKGTRMGSVDKGLQIFQGKPLVLHSIERLSVQVDHIIINANRHIESYQKFGYPVVADIQKDFAGPLAGIEAGLLSTEATLLMTVPCDSPFFPLNLAARLTQALDMHDASIAYAQTNDQPHPVFALYKTSVLSNLQDFLATGQRKIRDWHKNLNAISVNFDGQDNAFANINTLFDLNTLEINNGK